jgi:hypothetical protein
MPQQATSCRDIEGQFDSKYVEINLYPECGLDLMMDYSPDPRLLAMLLFLQDQKPQPHEWNDSDESSRINNMRQHFNRDSLELVIASLLLYL